MEATWWHHRPWKFISDMNGDGAVNLGDAVHWAQWVFFLPGDAFIAQFGPTELGQSLNLTQASFGSPASAWIAVGLWVVGAWALYCLYGFWVDVIDPTYRQQQREARQARARMRRARAQTRTHAYTAVESGERIEPTLRPPPVLDTPVYEADSRPKRTSVAGRG